MERVELYAGPVDGELVSVPDGAGMIARRLEWDRHGPPALYRRSSSTRGGRVLFGYIVQEK